MADIQAQSDPIEWHLARYRYDGGNLGTGIRMRTAKSLSAALWTRSKYAPREHYNNPEHEFHIICWRLHDAVTDVNVNGKMIHRGAARSKSFYVVRSGDQANLTGYEEPKRTLHLFIPTTALSEVLADEDLDRSFRRADLYSRAYDPNLSIERGAREIISEMLDRQPLAQARLDCMVQDMAIRLLRLQHPDRSLVQGTRRSVTRLKRATDLIEDRLTDDLSVAELAAAAGVSTVHLTILFRESMGMPPHQWILQRRLERAKLLLGSGRTSITDIALDCGFATSQHFSMTFRKHVGVTPSEFRRSVQS